MLPVLSLTCDEFYFRVLSVSSATRNDAADRPSERGVVVPGKRTSGNFGLSGGTHPLIVIVEGWAVFGGRSRVSHYTCDALSNIESMTYNDRTSMPSPLQEAPLLFVFATYPAKQIGTAGVRGAGPLFTLQEPEVNDQMPWGCTTASRELRSGMQA
jgi:hypothetical protein